MRLILVGLSLIIFSLMGTPTNAEEADNIKKIDCRSKKRIGDYYHAYSLKWTDQADGCKGTGVFAHAMLTLRPEYSCSSERIYEEKDRTITLTKFTNDAKEPHEFVFISLMAAEEQNEMSAIAILKNGTTFGMNCITAH